MAGWRPCTGGENEKAIIPLLHVNGELHSENTKAERKENGSAAASGFLCKLSDTTGSNEKYMRFKRRSTKLDV